jgi:hypothetical protein
MEDDEDKLIQREPVGPGAAALAPATGSAITARQGGGAPLPASTRRFFEPRFGTDLSEVRVHRDPAAADLAASVDARAFTVGQNMFFGSGQWALGIGDRLIAHEVAHVSQQQAGGSVIQRWTISGNTATVDRHSDTLGRLAARTGGRSNDWKCIRPLSMRTGERAGGQTTSTHGTSATFASETPSMSRT